MVVIGQEIEIDVVEKENVRETVVEMTLIAHEEGALVDIVHPTTQSTESQSQIYHQVAVGKI